MGRTLVHLSFFAEVGINARHFPRSGLPLAQGSIDMSAAFSTMGAAGEVAYGDWGEEGFN